MWINATALGTALNVSYMAGQLALFGIVVGIALLLAGIGFVILSLGGTLANAKPALALRFHKPQTTSAPRPA